MSKIFTPSHNEGCHIAAKYLHKNLNCGAVFVEANPFNNSESPDAIGFRPDGCSILIEVKVSRSDFLSDKKKPHRVNPETGMGSYRFFACPEGIILPEDLPPKWGLFYFTNRKSMKPIHAPVGQFSSLSSPKYYMDYVAHYLQQNPNEVPNYIQYYKELVEQFGHIEKNVCGEQNILYGAWRQLCIAQNKGVEYTVNEVFQRPAI